MFITYSMKYDSSKLGICRSLFEKAMLAEGIQIKASYETPIYLQSLYQKIALGNEGYPFKLNKIMKI